MSVYALNVWFSKFSFIVGGRAKAMAWCVKIRGQLCGVYALLLFQVPRIKLRRVWHPAGPCLISCQVENVKTESVSFNAVSSVSICSFPTFNKSVGFVDSGFIISIFFNMNSVRAGHF